ncbi:hypothetical protein COLO4_25228 [Corchorus olitorius]|uniref:Uncharacterized protein n=1 Tax=Corchorus olitorius TaxID=93759 RepID=A0A1R3I400_9ROSI|nr:hypothetical protein COLO4_25228 [Corchorus olitorius]
MEVGMVSCQLIYGSSNLFAFKIAPRKKLMEPTIMLPSQPKFLVTQEAANVETRLAK